MAAIDLDASIAAGSAIDPAATVRFTAGASLACGATLSNTPTVVVTPLLPLHDRPTREVSSGQLVFDYVDLFLGDGFTRAQDVGPSSLSLRVFFNGSELSWPLISGVGVSETVMAAGKVYWQEFSSGYYSLRFFPNAVGMWRLVLGYGAHDQAIALNYLAESPKPTGPQGLRTSFFKS